MGATLALSVRLLFWLNRATEGEISENSAGLQSFGEN